MIPDDSPGPVGQVEPPQGGHRKVGGARTPEENIRGKICILPKEKAK